MTGVRGQKFKLQMGGGKGGAVDTEAVEHFDESGERGLNDSSDTYQI